MASWDDEDFDPDIKTAASGAVTDKWEGEDEDDDVLDNWDDDDEDKEAKPAVTQPVKKKKKPLEERIREKQEKKRLEQLQREEELKQQEEETRELTPEEMLEEKLRNQRLQEESDLELAKDVFGIDSAPEPIPGLKTIDNFNPDSKEDFTELAQMITTKFSKFESKREYTPFLENLFRDLCTGVEADDIKRISNTLNILATEKTKALKAAKGGGKKKPAKKTLAAGKATKNSGMDDMDYGYNEYDDFM